MTPNEYQDLANRSVPQQYPMFRGSIMAPSLVHIVHAQMGVSSEAGELSDAVKKCVIYMQDLDFENVKEECGDLLWYISLMLSACGYTMEDCMKENIAKLKLRYPEKFTEKDALERKDKFIGEPVCHYCGELMSKHGDEDECPVRIGDNLQ